MTYPTQINDTLLEEGIRMQKRGLEPDNIRENLLQRTKNETEVEAVMKSLREMKFAHRRSRGGILCIAGSVLLVFGFVLVLLLQDSTGASRLAIYIPSIIGSGLILWGFVDLLGW